MFYSSTCLSVLHWGHVLLTGFMWAGVLTLNQLLLNSIVNICWKDEVGCIIGRDQVSNPLVENGMIRDTLVIIIKRIVEFRTWIKLNEPVGLYYGFSFVLVISGRLCLEVIQVGDWKEYLLWEQWNQGSLSELCSNWSKGREKEVD